MNVAPIIPSDWARQRFGSAAEALIEAVPAAIQHAQALATAAHDSSGLTSNDAYGATMRVVLHHALVDFTAEIPGVVARKPVGVRSRFPYVVIEETSVALMPWRYAVDGSVRRVDAKFPVPVSDLRTAMLSLNEHPNHLQPTLQETALNVDELEAMFAAEADMLDQLRSMGTVVTVALASNPVNGIVTLGWGDAQLANPETGKVIWHSWEELTMNPGTPLALRPVAPRPAPQAPVSRFDDAPEEDLHLVPQRPMTANPASEAGEGEADSGIASEQPTR